MILNFDWNMFPNEISRPLVPLTVFEVSTTFQPKPWSLGFTSSGSLSEQLIYEPSVTKSQDTFEKSLKNLKDPLFTEI
jgi:hypothetical protein